jgi:YihY family inner membrane protein
VPRRLRGAWRYLKAFYWKAFEDNLTGLSAMVAYNLLLSVLPLAFLALFIAGRLLESGELEESVREDLQQLFPTATENTITTLLDRIVESSTSFGIVALVASIWFGASFWGALDTAFCQIYHVRCRKWLEQKRFALGMLVVVLLFMAATVLVPTVQGLLIAGTEELPFGLDRVEGLVYAVTLVGGLVLLFGILCLIYWTVPNRLVPWHAVWPGALAATIAIAIVDYAFPAYLASLSSLARVGTTVVFVLILLIWFYALAIIILGGAVINAARFERHDTRELATGREEVLSSP